MEVFHHSIILYYEDIVNSYRKAISKNYFLTINKIYDIMYSNKKGGKFMIFFIILFISIICSVQFEEVYTCAIGICMGFFIGIVVEIAWIEGKYQIKNNPSNIKSQVKKQNDYDNKWGIIDWDEK